MTYQTPLGTDRVRSWTEGVPIEQEAIQQLRNMAELPIIHSHIAVMPDVHWGNGATAPAGRCHAARPSAGSPWRSTLRGDRRR